MSREISLDEIRRALEWTTPGKWEYHEKSNSFTAAEEGKEPLVLFQTLNAIPPYVQDTDWITHSRTYAEWLIHRVETLQQENAELAAQIVGHAA